MRIEIKGYRTVAWRGVEVLRRYHRRVRGARKSKIERIMIYSR